MKNAAYILLLALFAACTNQEEFVSGGQALPEGKYPLIIGLNVANSATDTPTTRIADDANGQSQWEGGEEVAVRIDGETTAKKYVVKKNGNSVTLEAATGVTPFYWQNSSETKLIEAWYPYNNGALPTSVQTGQSSKEGYFNSDVLYGTATISFSGSNSLTMYHQVAKVMVNIKKTDKLTNGDRIESISIGGSDFVTGCTYIVPQSGDSYTGTWNTASSAQKGSIIPCRVNTADADAYVASYIAMVIPQSITSNNTFITIGLDDGKYYAYKVGSGGTSLQINHVHTYNIEIDNLLSYHTGWDMTVNVADNEEVIIMGNGGQTGGQVTINGSGTVILKDVNISAGGRPAIKVESGNPTLMLEGKNILSSGQGEGGALYNAENTTLTIDGTGELTATGGVNCAGIGAGYSSTGAIKSCGKIIIKGGTITATGDGYGAGIGCAYHGSCQGIEILGGTITATAKNNSYRDDVPAIGNARKDDGTCQYIKLSNCTIRAYPSANGPAVKATTITPTYTDISALKTAGVTIYIKDELYTK